MCDVHVLQLYVARALDRSRVIAAACTARFVFAVDRAVAEVERSLHHEGRRRVLDGDACHRQVIAHQHENGSSAGRAGRSGVVDERRRHASAFDGDVRLDREPAAVQVVGMRTEHNRVVAVARRTGIDRSVAVRRLQRLSE